MKELNELTKLIKDQPFKVAFKATMGVAAAQLACLAIAGLIFAAFIGVVYLIF